MQEKVIYSYQIEKKKNFWLRLAEKLSKLSRYLALLGIILLLIAYIPSIFYYIVPEKIDVSKVILATIRNPNKSKMEKLVEPEVKDKPVYQPPINRSLSLENMVNIPSVGIKTKINEAPIENYEDALRIGVWRVPDFGTPYGREKPTILAAHRYGYLKWSIPYRLRNSFYNLPKLKVGDTVEIIWKQRKYTYEVYKEDMGEEITDYSADLILYTCKSLKSPIRVFKYARLLEI